MYDNLLNETFGFISNMKTNEFKYFKENTFYNKIKKGEMIFGTHDRCESIPMVIKGSLRLFRTSDEGREMTSYFITPGNMCILAAICTMGNIKYDFSAQAEEDTLMIMLGPESFKYMMENSSEFRNFVFLEMAEKLVSAFALIEDIKFTRVPDRLLRYIEKNADKNGELEITHEILAVNTGTVREVVSRQLKKLEKDGLLSTQRGRIKLF